MKQVDLPRCVAKFSSTTITELQKEAADFKFIFTINILTDGYVLYFMKDTESLQRDNTEPAKMRNLVNYIWNPKKNKRGGEEDEERKKERKKEICTSDSYCRISTFLKKQFPSSFPCTLFPTFLLFFMYQSTCQNVTQNPW